MSNFHLFPNRMLRFLSAALLLLLSLTSGAAPDVHSDIALLRERADSLHNVGKTDSAAMLGRQAVELAGKTGDPVGIVGANAAQGVFLRSLGRIDEALGCYNEALEIVTSEGFRANPSQEAIEEAATLYINLAVLNLDMQHKEAAAEHAAAAGEWVARSEDPELRSAIYGVAGSVLTGCGELRQALAYQNMAYQDALASGNRENAFRGAAYTMLIADRLGDGDSAREWRARCKELLPEIDSSMARLVYYQAECSICLKHDDRRGALHWFDEILKSDGIDQLPFVKFDCYNNMHTAFAGLGEYRNAYETLLKSNELRDSLWQKEKTESLRELTVKYETREKELALAESKAREARTLNWLFASIALLLAVGIVFVVYAGRSRRRRMQRELEFAALRADTGRQLTHEYINGLEAERQRMARELHDGVCNDLLGIEMNLNAGMPLERSVELIGACRESVRRISHELMPPEFAYATLDEVLRFFIVKQSEANAGRIRISYSSEDLASTGWASVPDDVALEVYRIVQEAVSNAVKHSGASEINVAMSLEAGRLAMKVYDNGTFASSGKKGLGLGSIRKRAESIGGKVRLDTSAGHGTELTVTVGI